MARNHRSLLPELSWLILTASRHQQPDDFYGIFRMPLNNQLPETKVRRTCTDRGSASFVRCLKAVIRNIWKTTVSAGNSSIPSK